MDQSKGKKVILTVDDTAVNLAIIRSILRSNYDVRVCKDGSMAKYLVDHIPIDLALLDINMPVVSGFELLDYIRNKSKQKDLPVFFVTGSATKEFINKAVNAGAMDYIIKPIKPAILNDKVAAVLRSRQAVRESGLLLDENRPTKKPELRKNAGQTEVIEYLSYMFTGLNAACLAGNCDLVESLVKELDKGNFGGIINRTIDEIAALMISFEYEAVIKSINTVFNALANFDMYTP
ncbi:response regulator [Treponema primitia]|uniref:response regulator n=1 Tax=Treponema primitia TaxID=88058 RepID=UPI00397F4928